MNTEYPDVGTLAEEFNNYFMNKVDNIRKTMPTPTNIEEPQDIKDPNFSFLDEFRPTNIDEVQEILSESDFKCSPSDVLPTNPFKENIVHFQEALVKLVNLSLAEGNVDVIITDGFSGNIALKTAEGTAKLVTFLLEKSFKSSIFSKIGYLLSKNGLKKMK